MVIKYFVEFAEGLKRNFIHMVIALQFGAICTLFVKLEDCHIDSEKKVTGKMNELYEKVSLAHAAEISLSARVGDLTKTIQDRETEIINLKKRTKK